MIFTKYINIMLEKFNPLLNWWFVGILVLLYWVLLNILGVKGEILEWNIYISSFIIALLYFLVVMNNILRINLITKAILSIPFYILIFYDYTTSITDIIFIIASAILLLFKSKIYNGDDSNSSNIVYLIYYIMLFHISSKIVYWSDFNEFIWPKVSEISEYYIYANIIETIVPIVVMAILFISMCMIILSLNEDYDFKLLNKYWLVIPFFIFFIEAFNTSSYFSKIAGGARYHWQSYIGVVEMMEQNGFLLWDTPSTYGFLSLISIYLMPFEDVWIRMYFLNSVLRLIFCLLVFYVIWNRKGVLWYFISIIMTLALVYYLPAAPHMGNTGSSPSGGAMRFFWVVLLMYIVVELREKDIKLQTSIITPVWLIGVFWSIESAFFVCAVLGPYVLYNLFFNPKKSFYHFKCISVIPITFILAVIIITLFYIYKLGHPPDYYAFIEEAVGNVSGYFSQLFTLKNPLWIHVIILSWLISKFHNNRNNHIIFSIWLGLWAVSSYSIGQSVGAGPLKFFVIFIFGLFLSIKMLENDDQKKIIYYFIPLFVMIITIAFGNPKSARHLYNTIRNQDYTLKNANYKEVKDFHEILSIINPNQTPVVYIDETRYLNYLSKRRYVDINTGQTVNLSNQLWLPLHPPGIIEGYPLERKVEYINRWISRHPVNEGWIVNPKENWFHRNYEEAIQKAILGTYSVKQKIEHGLFKAVLYERK